MSQHNKHGKYNIDFKRIIQLITKYVQLKKSGEIRKYNEESTKKDFILPLFEALVYRFHNRLAIIYTLK